MIAPFGALVLNSFREARRNRISIVVAAFALVLLSTSILVTEVTIYTFQRVLTDFGLGVMSILLVVLAIFFSTNQLTREIERRTIFLVVSKPISRTTFILGKLAGNMVTLVTLLVIMSAVFFVEVKVYRYSITKPQLIALAMLVEELLVISSVGFAISSFAGQIVSAVVTLGTYFAGHLIDNIYLLSGRSHSEVVQAVGKVAYYLLPNLHRLNFRPMAAHELLVPTRQILESAAYGLGYAGVMMSIAIFVFSRRDFK